MNFVYVDWLWISSINNFRTEKNGCGGERSTLMEEWIPGNEGKKVTQFRSCLFHQFLEQLVRRGWDLF